MPIKKKSIPQCNRQSLEPRSYVSSRLQTSVKTEDTFIIIIIITFLRYLYIFLFVIIFLSSRRNGPDIDPIKKFYLFFFACGSVRGLNLVATSD